MNRKQFAGIICGALLAVTIMDYRLGIVYLGEPFIIPAITYAIAHEYYGAVDVPYQYMGSGELDRERAEGAEWKGWFYYEREPWAFVIDSQEEFDAVYAEHGMDGTYAEGFDYSENILILSINKRIDHIFALEHEVVWHDELPYIAPDFLYQGEMDKDMIYYYKVPRSDVQYETETGTRIAKLHLSKPIYDEKRSGHVNFFPLFNKWGWAFDRFNYGG